MIHHANPHANVAQVLDNLDAIRVLDPHGMLDLTERFPDQCRDALQISRDFLAAQGAPARPSSIIITGLGGSAIGGDLVRALVEIGGDVPVIVNRDYRLPGFAGPNTLVIASSYSGNTEETVSAYEHARDLGCPRICITSGGELARHAARDGVPCCIVPGGRPPRASTGYLFIPTLAVVAASVDLGAQCGLNAVDASLGHLDELAAEWRRENPVSDNPAKELAVALHGRIPIFYGAQGWTSVLALRWKGQFNENAKVHAFANALPEQNHNEILGWTRASQQSSIWSVVYLRDPQETEDQPRIARRIAVLQAVIASSAEQHEVWATGDSLMERLLGTLYYGDFVSVYAALLAGVDPTDIAGIDLLKGEMANLNGNGR